MHAIRTAIFSTLYFCFYFSYFSIFLFNNAKEDYYKMGNKNKNLLKKYSQANKVQLHQRSQEYYRNLSEVEKIKKKYADIRNKIFLLKEYKKKKLLWTKKTVKSFN